MGGVFCTKLGAFNEKKVAFLNILLFISVGKAWNTSFLSEKYQYVFVQIPPVSAGSCNSQAPRPPLSQKVGLLGTPPALMTHSPFD